VLRAAARRARGLIAAGLAAAAVVSCRAPDPPGELVMAGVIEARSTKPASLIGGRVVKIFVEEGQEVAAGDLLLTLDTHLLDLQIEEQRYRVAEARSQAQLLRHGRRPEEIERGRVAWQSAEATRRRLERLAQEGIISAQSHEEAEALAAQRSQELKELTSGNRDEDIRSAEAVAAREDRHLAYLEGQRSEARVVAPIRGVVETLSVRVGDVLEANQPVAEILASADLWLNAYVPEPYLGLVRIGQQTRISVDSFPGRSFRGQVVDVADQAEYTPRNIQTFDQRSEQVFRVKITLDPGSALKPGMAATVRLADMVLPLARK
jgi:HlyD family secretion protein